MQFLFQKEDEVLVPGLYSPGVLHRCTWTGARARFSSRRPGRGAGLATERGGRAGGVRVLSPPRRVHLQPSRRPVHFPGSVPNSVVLQQMWPHREVSGLGAPAPLTSHGRHQAREDRGARSWALWKGARVPAACQRPPVLSPLQPGGSQDMWLPRRRGRQWHAKWQQKLIQWLGEEEAEEEEDDDELYLDWASDSLSPRGHLSELEEAKVGTH